ncbi:MAG TPA: hypothetical protein VK624_03405 [Steroidobacteraceae bacterium]|nr:hypothetical protein [Steroidobacteraceae bacterium]
MRVVRSLDELLTLPRDRHVNGFREREPLMLEIPELSRPMLMRAQDALNRLQERGGRLAGAGFMFIALLAGVSKVLHDNGALLSWRAFGELAAVLVVSFALGFAAKWAALVITRWQFAYRCRAQHYLLSLLLPR